MTPVEMLNKLLDGKSVEEISKDCEMTTQEIKTAISGYVNRGCRSIKYLEKIKYKGIYEYFKKNPFETVTGFAKKLWRKEGQHGGLASHINTLRTFFLGEVESRFTIPQIKRMCEIVGKPFEEVFEERKKE